MSQTPEFLYPRLREYAFDEVCEQIVRALEKRHFDVPDIDVQFDTYGSGEQQIRMTRRITGHEFSLYFSRTQGPLPGGIYKDIAAVHTVAIPREQITVYQDNSGPTYLAYVGDDWERDREGFFGNSCVVNSKLNGEPRTYLKYRGSDETEHSTRHTTKPAKYLLHDSDLGSEYDLGPDDEPFLHTSDVTDRMTRHLKAALKKIEEAPEKKSAYRFKEEAAVPIKGLPEFWVHTGAEATSRIQTGQSNVERLPLAKRYALGVDLRLLPYGCPTEGLGIDPDVLHAGYIWSSPNPDEIPYEGRSSFGSLVRIQPKRVNEIYVIDQAAYDRTRAELSAKLDKENEHRPEGDKRTRFTRAERYEPRRSRAKTLTPWSEYRGDFEKPIVLIGRELGFDEVQIIRTVA